MKFIAYILSYLFYPFPFLVPRSGGRWVFGSFKGGFDGNSKYLFIYAYENKKLNLV